MDVNIFFYTKMLYKAYRLRGIWKRFKQCKRRQNHPMQEKEPFVQNMDELQLMIEETNKDVFAKDASISATCCVCLKAENVVGEFIDSVAMK